MTEGRGSPQSTHFGLVSPNFVLGLALGIGVPRAVDQGCSGHDELDVVAKGPVLVQLLCSGYGLLGAVNKGWVGRYHVYGFILRHVLVLGL